MDEDTNTESNAESNVSTDAQTTVGDETSITTNRETVQTWVESSGGKPGFRTDAEGTRTPHVYYPEADTDDSAEESSWEEFFETFEEHELALVRHADRPDEGPDQFELVDRAEAVERATLEDESVEEALMEGETVRSEVVETKVIEREVVETETIESQVVDSEIVNDEVVGDELVRREVVGIHLGEERDLALVEDQTLIAEHDAYSDRFAENEVITVDVEETRTVTREQLERKLVESTVVDVDVEERETVESDTLEGRVDLEGVQRTIVESDIFGGETDYEAVVEEDRIRSEFTEDETIATELFERRTVEEEILDRKRLTFELVAEEVVDSETILSEVIERELLSHEESREYAGREVMTDTTDETATATGTEGTTDVETAATEETTAAEETVDDSTEPPTLTPDDGDVGKRVVDASGQKVGVVTEVDEDAPLVYVDPNPGITERIKTRLGWEGHDEDAYSVSPDRIENIDHDEVRLKSL